MDEVTVKMETRFYIECPECGAEEDVDSYETSEFECLICGAKREFNSDPGDCEVV